MDEWTLNDLLECSVCLERLDTSSKVLPCQHTFCKKCLEEIVHTRKELRCPECRVLVEIGIEDLPPNVLLMRILEGMRNGPRRSASGVHSFQSETVSFAESSKSLASNVSSHLRVRSRSLNPQCSQTSDVHQPYAIALYDYAAKEPGDLSFKRNDMILLRRKIDNIWYQGECNGVLGVFPLPYVQVKTPLLATYPSHIPQCKALYDFNKCHEDDGCLYFTKGDTITVIRRIDENWAEGKVDDRIGMFPISFVELNHHAKNLMKATSNNTTFSRDPPPTPTEESLPLISTESTSSVNSSAIQTGVIDGVNSSLSLSSSSSSTATTSPTSSSESTTPSSLSVSPLSSQPASSANTKRHSFTLGAQPPPYQAPPAVHRHSAEILKPEESFESDDLVRNTTEQRIQKTLQLPLQKPTAAHSEETPTRQTCHRKKQPIQSEELQSLNSLAKPINGSVIENFQRQTSLRISKNSSTHSKLYGSPSLPAMYIAIYPYKPQKTDELELKIGSVYTVIERCQDGWYKGTSHPNQKCGVFPGNYVTPVKSLPMLHAQLRGLVHSSGSPKHDTRASSEVRASTLQCKSNLVSMASPIAVQTQSNGNMSCLAPPELPARSISPILHSSTSQKNSSTVWHVSCSETQPDKLGTTTVSTAKNRSKNEISENNEPSITASSISAQKSNTVKVSKPSERGKEKKDKGSVSLMRRLTSMKKSKSPPPTSSSYSIDNPVFDDGGLSTAVPVAHVRSDSCPSQLSYNTPTHASSSSTNNHSVVGGSQRVKHKQRSSLQNQFPRTSDGSAVSPSNSKFGKNEKPIINHRKSSSLDTTVYDDRHKSKPVALLPRERYRCIAPYPPNSEFELELRVDDIIFVHKKREDGWYKGTLQRNGRTGLFPASFVENA